MNITNRQLECIVHLANGKTVPEIALALFISKSTVDKCLTSAKSKLHATNNAHLVSIVIAKKLLVWYDEDNEHGILDKEKEPSNGQPFDSLKHIVY